MGKRFVVSSYDLQAVLNENADRHCLPVGMFPEKYKFDDEPVPTMYNPDRFVKVEDVPESLEDEELRLLGQIDENIMSEREAYEILPFAGEEPRLCVPGRVVKTVKRVLHPERKRPVAACFCALTGLLIFVY